MAKHGGSHRVVFIPKAGNGRRPYPLETMPRIDCMQHWYNLSDGAIEDALYEIASMRLFARSSLDSALPDRTTILHPPPAGAASTGPPIVQDHQSLAGRSRRHHDSRHLGRCHHH
ncbi:transposase [Escherichia coli]